MPGAMLWRSSASGNGYENYYSGCRPGLFIFLIDQSHAMADRLRNGETIARNVAQAINGWLQNLVIGCSFAAGIRDCANIAVLGYRSDEHGNPIIEPALIGPLAGRELVSISEVAASPARIDNVAAYMQDEDTGEMIEMPQHVPAWIDPVAIGKSPLCAAIARACRIVDEWIPRFPDTFPPLVVNVSSGSFSDGTPWPFADALKRRGTRDGHVLFMNTYVSARDADATLFPHTVRSMHDVSASTLFACSSYLPLELLHRMRVMGHQFPDQAKCVALNADLTPSLFRVLPFPVSEPPWERAAR